MPDTNHCSDDDLAILQEFVEDSKESLVTVESLVSELKQKPENRVLIDAIYRPIHSIKGNSAFLGLLKVRSFTHEMEGLLDRIKEGHHKPDHDIIGTLFSGVNLLQDMLVGIQEQQIEVPDQEKFEQFLKLFQTLNQKKETEIESDALPSSPEAGIAGPPDISEPSVSLPIDEFKKISEHLSGLKETFGLLNNLASSLAETTPEVGEELEQLSKQFESGLELLNRILESVSKNPVDSLIRRAKKIVDNLSTETGKPVELIL
ncbi:MAG: hypothetical protein GX811_07035, partial [Lentisphaerae bacterium]|nr:hypothetical protein [Lentisphaerota bacterium]